MKYARRRMALIAITLVSQMSWAQSEDDQIRRLEAGRTKKLSENQVVEMFRKGGVSLKEEKARAAQTRLGSSLTTEQYQARLKSQFNLQRTTEEPLNPFQPVLSPYEDWNVGVDKRLPIGANLGVQAFGTQYSFDGNMPVSNATQVGLRATARIDLWKNLFGSLDRAELTTAEARKRRADVEERVNTKKREIELRKAFWSFVAAAQSISLSEELTRTANLQLKDARSRAREGAADRGEVARYQSQVESRNASMLLFMYQREVTMQSFERQFSEFRSTEWALDETSLDANQAQVEQCMMAIAKNTIPDMNHTLVDEMIGLLKAETESEIKIAGQHNSADLAFIGQYQTTGADNSYARAREEIADKTKGGYAVGLQLSIPLGSSGRRSEENLLSAKKNSLEAQQEALAHDLRSSHETMLKALLYLRSGLKNQVENSRNLTVNFQEMQKKYRQGRIPVSTLVLEQDSLFQSRLTEIDLRRQIAHVILDYFTLFTEHPCSWNKI
jgi:outer membrane protein TolC